MENGSKKWARRGKQILNVPDRIAIDMIYQYAYSNRNMRQISRTFDVPYSTAVNIISRRAYKHLRIPEATLTKATEKRMKNKRLGPKYTAKIRNDIIQDYLSGNYTARALAAKYEYTLGGMYSILYTAKKQLPEYAEALKARGQENKKKNWMKYMGNHTARKEQE